MRTIEIDCVVVSDEVYTALEREVKELGILAASCETPFTVEAAREEDSDEEETGKEN